MTRTITFLSFLSLGLLIYLSIVAPNSSAVWLASTSQNYNFVRGGLMALLFTFLITKPPRNTVFRIISGMIAVVLGVWSLVGVFSGTVPVLDALLFIASSIAVGISVIEHLPEKNRSTVNFQHSL